MSLEMTVIGYISFGIIVIYKIDVKHGDMTDRMCWVLIRYYITGYKHRCVWKYVITQINRMVISIGKNGDYPPPNEHKPWK
jgi:hypothetical protein